MSDSNRKLAEVVRNIFETFGNLKSGDRLLSSDEQNLFSKRRTALGKPELSCDNNDNKMITRLYYKKAQKGNQNKGETAGSDVGGTEEVDEGDEAQEG